MKGLVSKYSPKPGVIFDIGSQDINGTYKPLFDGWQYHGVDIAMGINVDIIMTDSIPVPDGYADLVISGQTLEHCKNPFALVKEMARILKPNGFMFLIAPFRWTQHRYPIDCWRFLPDGMRCLIEPELKFVASAISKSSPTEDDCWAVGQK
jgi:SAM-dependent methyltransferase